MSAAKKTNVIRMQEAEEHHLHDDEDLFRPHKKGEEGEGPWLVSYADLMTLLMGFFALMFSMSTPDSKKMEKIRQAAVSSFGGKMEQPYLGLTNDLKEFIKENNLDDKVLIKTTIDGVEMTFVGTLFFDSGDFRVKQDAAQLMEQLAGVIKKKPNNFRALIEGHTDSAPIRHPIISSNWELSGLRASRIAQIFEANGFEKKMLTIIGWGENKPLFKEQDESGVSNVENMAKNRRVVIRVYDRKYSNDPIRD